MVEKLKLCPFCGGKATAFKDNYNGIGIMCENCKLYFGIELECGEELVDGWRARIKTVDEAVKRWNKRAYNENVCARFLPNNGDDLCVNDSGASGCKCHGQIDNCDFYDKGGFLYE